jgi:hypothetical protein
MKLFTLMALNAQGIGTSALETFERQLQSIETSEAHDVMEYLDVLRPVIDEHSDMFTHAEASGLYLLHSKLNHSCQPNAIIQYRENKHRVYVVAIRDIHPGEEVTISYLPELYYDTEEEEDEEDSDEGVHLENGDECCPDDGEDGHKEALKRYYLFDCACPE